MPKRTVLGILLTNRMTKAQEFQKILSEKGCHIKTRIGLHDASEGVCSASGVILLELVGEQSGIDDLERQIRQLEGTVVQKMVFEE